MSNGMKLLLATGGVSLLMLLSLMVGARWILPSQVMAALLSPDALNVNHILVTTRLSRTLMAVTVGASLAVAGVLMQALTRNPLASPGLFGVNAGATFFVILFSSLFSLHAPGGWLWSAFAGAAIAGALVWLIGNMGQGSLSPLRIVLAGAAITALFSALSQALLVVDQEGLDTVLFYLAGSLSERSLPLVLPLVGGCLAALLAAFTMAGQVNVLNAGDEIATGLGQRTGMIRALMSFIIIILVSSAVALAGSIGFIGLVVPHMVRKGLAIDHRWLLPGSALLGAGLLLLADMLARVVILPQEVPVGVMTALFGAPFFIMLARRGGLNG
ncbi:putative siderophore transport system permease protein YfiZ precursor (plasmid) [Sodalis glossinidius str. 'morsitans']|uniref:Achromobactin ABC transporter permease component cbrB n=1 Tax=Sodalis glossinidius (strain morsitans) TaxID=343509 RepID=Q2NQ31_SODGM|nr:iron ABC transporter permease [Sodalis glossinidius]BAE75744.1 achromobactin ABC transporter permease component cbrB [Sodalis glossinidius str. 'morsitans']CAI59482.1 CbrB protein [Sodalis glossinidius]CRL46863.1 putative siderophore transport system permease protein YfiZ precursor [Sodalis glossinidius str. 'morsitans']